MEKQHKYEKAHLTLVQSQQLWKSKYNMIVLVYCTLTVFRGTVSKLYSSARTYIGTGILYIILCILASTVVVRTVNKLPTKRGEDNACGGSPDSPHSINLQIKKIRYSTVTQGWTEEKACILAKLLVRKKILLYFPILSLYMEKIHLFTLVWQ